MITDTQPPVFHALKTEQPAALICPLRTIAYSSGPMSGRQCLETQCAWWHRKMETCQVNILAAVLAGLALNERLALIENETEEVHNGAT